MQQTAWLVAAENGHLPGGKVGGVGDVIRDLPIALQAQGARCGWKIRIITPAYGRFHRLPGASKVRRLKVDFAGRVRYAEVWRFIPPGESVETLLIAHALLDPRGDGRIYHEDDQQQPFATDATKFAFFNAAVAALVQTDLEPPDVLHLHDWHTGLLPALKAVAPVDTPLQRARCVFTIHNLAYQGIRPLDGLASSLKAWFPKLNLPVQKLTDPRYADCVNFMVSGIRLADGLNTVSPTYAKEITRPSNPALGFIGGEGLEQDLQQAVAEHRLLGILNGCRYEGIPSVKPAWTSLQAALQQHQQLIASNDPARQWLQSIICPRHLLTSVGRLVTQKVTLLLEPVFGHATAIEAMLENLGSNSLLILLGSGDRELEQRLAAIAAQHSNFLFLRGYAESLSASLYANGDLFLMPSSFEPCGISQMLAMRSGQPCVVHGVGGLKDTVHEGETGFVFEGDTVAAQATAFISSVQQALTLREQDKASWQAMRKAAAAKRFSWQRAAQAYIDELYTDGG
ncbi:MAG: glycogen/starch synthase [Xanthomonadales bacterium]|nr:glycogen/starch synthase [Xanthomonadales bacterium]